MVNFVETMFGVCAVCFLAALVLLVMGRRAQARRLALGGVITGAIAAVLEIYIRL